MQHPSGKLNPAYKHGHSLNGKHSPEYEAYNCMKARCFNKNNRSYSDYGGRGITMCARWLGETGFKNFLEDMGLRPKGKYSLDRIDNRKGYSKKNCRWATTQEQGRNRRGVWEVLIGREWTGTVDAAKSLGIPYSTLANSIRGFQPLPKKLWWLEYRRKY